MLVRLVPLAAVAVLMFIATTSHAVDPVAKCQSSKLKAWGKLRSCEDKEAAKAVLGKIPDVASCRTRFDDALTKASTACRYINNGDGTVTDLDTGLMWQRTDDAGGVTDKDNIYMWSDTGTAPDGSAFVDFLAELNDCVSNNASTVSGGYAGHCDWRLPQVDELAGIVDCSFGNPCIDQSAFGPTGAPTRYWAATSFADDPPLNAWDISFLDGSAHQTAKQNIFSDKRVRAVRVGL